MKMKQKKKMLRFYNCKLFIFNYFSLSRFTLFIYNYTSLHPILNALFIEHFHNIEQIFNAFVFNFGFISSIYTDVNYGILLVQS